MKNNFIHPTCIIEETSIIGDNNYFGPYCYITGNTIIGNNNRFEGFCSIGTPPESKGWFDNKTGKVVIGDFNVVREYVTINAGSTKSTVVENNCTLLRGSHIGHDSHLENNVTISCNVLVGGFTYIMEGANLGLGVACHQYSVIGAYSMLGMNSTVTKTTRVIPGWVMAGSPAKRIKDNTIGLNRFNVSNEYLNYLIERFVDLEKNIKQ